MDSNLPKVRLRGLSCWISGFHSEGLLLYLYKASLLIICKAHNYCNGEAKSYCIQVYVSMWVAVLCQ